MLLEYCQASLTRPSDKDDKKAKRLECWQEVAEDRAVNFD
jgi:hypothetical protein